MEWMSREMEAEDGCKYRPDTEAVFAVVWRQNKFPCAAVVSPREVV